MLEIDLWTTYIMLLHNLQFILRIMNTWMSEESTFEMLNIESRAILVFIHMFRELHVATEEHANS